MDFLAICSIGLKSAKNQKLINELFFGLFWFSMAQTLKNNLPKAISRQKLIVEPLKTAQIGVSVFVVYGIFHQISINLGPYWLALRDNTHYIKVLPFFSICFVNFLTKSRFPEASGNAQRQKL